MVFVHFNDLSDLEIESTFLTVLDIILELKTGDHGSLVVLDPRFRHGSKLIPLGKFNVDYRKLAIGELKNIGAFAAEFYNESVGKVDFDRLRSTWGFRPIPDRLNQLRSDLGAVRESRGFGPVLGPLAKSQQPIVDWSDVEIKLISPTEIRATVGDSPTKRITMVELGLNDGRKGDAASELWGALMLFAQSNGQISAEVKFASGMPKKVERLGKKLKGFFKISKNPFHKYTKRDGYRTRFRISDGTNGTIDNQSIKRLFRTVHSRPSQRAEAIE